MKTANRLLAAAIALAVAAPSSADMCSTADQAFYQATRDAAAGRLTALKASAATESAAAPGLTSQLATIDFSQAPQSLPILTSAISTLGLEMANVSAAVDAYNSAYAAGLGGRLVSVAQNAMASTATSGAAAAQKSAGNLAGAIAQVQAVVQPLEAMALKSELASHLQNAQTIANQAAAAFNDAASSHSQIGSCAQKSEAANNKGQPQQKAVKNFVTKTITKYGPGIGEASQTVGNLDNPLAGVQNPIAVPPSQLAQFPNGTPITLNGLPAPDGNPYIVSDVCMISASVACAPGHVDIWVPK